MTFIIGFKCLESPVVCLKPPLSERSWSCSVRSPITHSTAQCYPVLHNITQCYSKHQVQERRISH
ncbi:hypothetical protein AAFF_G00229710 [Aldrovandia affinis]|uniref:Uncharacterized protein n=1 Tax=Aldrovandia affinis TaxID=143900 RepID=A0AAD7SVQ9_9TELE|nr:hypothetical protein AAFF_G00229710 [Aldrovandia affinis]